MVVQSGSYCELFRELWESHYSDLASAARRFCKKRLRDINRERVANGDNPLSPGDYRDMASDMSQNALADHWRRFATYCADRLPTITQAENWLATSRLRFPRRDVGSSKPEPMPTYCPALWSLSPDCARFCELRADGLTLSAIATVIFGDDSAKNLVLVKRLAQLSELQLSLQAEIESALIDFRYAREVASELSSAVCGDNSERSELRRSRQHVDPNRAYELAAWYRGQNQLSYARESWSIAASVHLDN